MTIVCARGANGEQITELGPHDQEAVDRFAAFLQLRNGVSQRVADGRYRVGDTLPAWHRYAMRLAVWRMERSA